MSAQSHLTAFAGGVIASFFVTSEIILNSDYLKNQANMPVHCDSENSQYLENADAYDDHDETFVGTPTGTLNEIQQIAYDVATSYQVDPQLIFAMIEVESSWRETVVSHKGAVGYMQLMPATAKEICGLETYELYEGAKNIGCGVKYLRHLIDKTGNITTAVQSYNAGYNRIVNQKIIPSETRQYVVKIKQNGGNI